MWQLNWAENNAPLKKDKTGKNDLFKTQQVWEHLETWLGNIYKNYGGQWWDICLDHHAWMERRRRQTYPQVSQTSFCWKSQRAINSLKCVVQRRRWTLFIIAFYRPVSHKAQHNSSCILWPFAGHPILSFNFTNIFVYVASRHKTWVYLHSGAKGHKSV